MNEKTRQSRTCRQTVPVATPQLLREVCGPAHVHLQQLERAFADDNLRAESQGGEIVITGQNDACRRAADALDAFIQRIASGAEASPDELASRLLDPTLRMALLQCSLLLALADGKVSAAERERILEYAQALGISPVACEELESVIESWIRSGDRTPPL